MPWSFVIVPSSGMSELRLRTHARTDNDDTKKNAEDCNKNNSKILQAHSILECFVPGSPLIYDVCTHEHLTRCGHTLRYLYPWRSCVLKFLIFLKIINDVSMAFSLVHSSYCVTKLLNVIWYHSDNVLYMDIHGYQGTMAYCNMVPTDAGGGSL